MWDVQVGLMISQTSVPNHTMCQEGHMSKATSSISTDRCTCSEQTREKCHFPLLPLSRDSRQQPMSRSVSTKEPTCIPSSDTEVSSCNQRWSCVVLLPLCEKYAKRGSHRHLATCFGGSSRRRWTILDAPALRLHRENQAAMLRMSKSSF